MPNNYLAFQDVIFQQGVTRLSFFGLLGCQLGLFWLVTNWLEGLTNPS